MKSSKSAKRKHQLKTEPVSLRGQSAATLPEIKPDLVLFEMEIPFVGIENQPDDDGPDDIPS